MKIIPILSIIILLLITLFAIYCWAISEVNIIYNCYAEKFKMKGDMKGDIKGDLISLLQSRMDKCTTEQFWAVGVLTGLSVFLISKKSIIQKRKLDKWVIIIAQVVLSGLGIWFVVHRHVSWFELECELRLLLEDETIAPKMLKKEIVRWGSDSLSGVLLYTLWIFIACMAGVVSYCTRPLKTSMRLSPSFD